LANGEVGLWTERLLKKDGMENGRRVPCAKANIKIRGLAGKLLSARDRNIGRPSLSPAHRIHAFAVSGATGFFTFSCCYLYVAIVASNPIFRM
jgi:hypothetical protein